MPATEPSNAKRILLVVAVAIVASLVVTLIQVLMFGKANVAITGGVVGATVVVLGLNGKRKKSN
jgi:hypothetical protein